MTYTFGELLITSYRQKTQSFMPLAANTRPGLSKDVIPARTMGTIFECLWKPHSVL